MKTIAACFVSSGLTVILMLFLLPFDSGERCETIQAAYDRNQELYEQRIVQLEETLNYALSRLAVAQGLVAKYREVEEMRALAAKWTPVEQAAKVEATLNHTKVDTAWWQRLKAEVNRLAGKVPAPRVP